MAKYVKDIYFELLATLSQILQASSVHTLLCWVCVSHMLLEFVLFHTITHTLNFYVTSQSVCHQLLSHERSNADSERVHVCVCMCVRRRKTCNYSPHIWDWTDPLHVCTCSTVVLPGVECSAIQLLFAEVVCHSRRKGSTHSVTTLSLNHTYYVCGYMSPPAPHQCRTFIWSPWNTKLSLIKIMASWSHPTT